MNVHDLSELMIDDWLLKINMFLWNFADSRVMSLCVSGISC